MQAVWQHSRQSGGALVLLLAIADNAHDDGDSAYPSIATLAKKARMTERNVNLLLKQLVEAGEIGIRQGEGPRGTNVYRVNLHDGPAPENISPLKTFHPEKSGTGGVKNPVKGGEAHFRGGVKPTSPKPSVNHQREPSREPSERVRAMPRVTTTTFQPDAAFREWAATEFPWMDFDAVLTNWRDYHLSKGTAIKNYPASLRFWLRREHPPPLRPLGKRNGQHALSQQEHNDLAFMEAFGDESADIPEVIEATFRRH
jgi:hypothetical protein